MKLYLIVRAFLGFVQVLLKDSLKTCNFYKLPLKKNNTLRFLLLQHSSLTPVYFCHSTYHRRGMIAQRELECSYHKAEWMLCMQKEEISITIYNMYSAIIIYQALYYAFFRYYIVLYSIHK